MQQKTDISGPNTLTQHQP